MKKADLITGCVLMALSGFVIWESLRMPPSATFGPGPGFLPFWIGVIVAGLALILFLTAWMRRVDPDAPPLFPGRSALTAVGLVLLALALYTIFMETLGFLANTLLFVTFLMAVVQRAGLKTTAAVAVLTTAGLYTVFHLLLGITLPRSPFGF
jgi:hypothetical protein